METHNLVGITADGMHEKLKCRNCNSKLSYKYDKCSGHGEPLAICILSAKKQKNCSFEFVVLRSVYFVSEIKKVIILLKRNDYFLS